MRRQSSSSSEVQKRQRMPAGTFHGRGETPTRYSMMSPVWRAQNEEEDTVGGVQTR